MNKSTHRVEVVPVVLEPHPNADSLSIVRVYGYTCVVRTEDWRDLGIGAYIVPDSVVPDTERFKFLSENRRIKVRRFRGVLSQGLLVPAPEGSNVGDDVAEILGITRYEPPESVKTGGDLESPPPGYFPVYDLEDWHRYGYLLVPGEEVFITEKIHGANSRFVFINDQFYAGSHKTWKKQDDSILWWRLAKENPWIERWCRKYPGAAIYGEAYGYVQSLKYGAKKGQVFFRAFDVLSPSGEFVSPFSFLDFFSTDTTRLVPLVYRGPYDPEKAKKLSMGKSLATDVDQLREGVVVEPVIPRIALGIGRVKFKIVSDEYLEKGK